MDLGDEPETPPPPTRLVLIIQPLLEVDTPLSHRKCVSNALEKQLLLSLPKISASPPHKVQGPQKSDRSLLSTPPPWR